jgi:hypothetical protein
LKLTDGWYSIKAVLDEELSKLVKGGRIKVGLKLYIYGAKVGQLLLRLPF